MSYIGQNNGPIPIGIVTKYGDPTASGAAAIGLLEAETLGNTTQAEQTYDPNATTEPVEFRPLGEPSFSLGGIVTIIDEELQSDDLNRPNIPGLRERGIDNLKPYIVSAMKYLPVARLSNSNNEANLSLKLGNDRDIKVNQVLRLIELHRSINKVVKITAEKIMTQSVIISKQQLNNTFSNTLVDFKSAYNQITGGSLSEEDFLNKIYELLSVQKIILVSNRILNNFNFNYLVFRVISVESVGSDPGDFYETILNNAVQKFKDYKIKISNEETLEEFNLRLFMYLVKNNDTFSNSLQFKKIVEIGLIRQILKTFKQYILGANSLRKKYAEALDLNVLSNEYKPQETLADKAIDISKVINNVTALLENPEGPFFQEAGIRSIVLEQEIENSAIATNVGPTSFNI